MLTIIAIVFLLLNYWVFYQEGKKAGYKEFTKMFTSGKIHLTMNFKNKLLVANEPGHKVEENS